ncbi:MAG: hypothetical protein NVSMB42_17490 [Herpetosiphon sp.]
MTFDRVCEACPPFPTHPNALHWSHADSCDVGNDLTAQRADFRTIAGELLIRLRYLLSLPHPVTGQRLARRALEPSLDGSP